MSEIVGDVRFALRAMAKSPGISLLMIGTLAVGLAANGVIFNLLDAMVLRPFDFPNTSRLVRLWETSPGGDGIDRENVSPANLLDWQAQARGPVAELIAMDEWETSLRTDGASEHVEAALVSPGFFEALGVAPAAGRTFLAEAARTGQDRRVVLSDALWRRSFGGVPMVGRTVTLNMEPYEVVGIAPSWAACATAGRGTRRGRSWPSSRGGSRRTTRRPTPGAASPSPRSTSASATPSCPTSW